MDWKTEYPLPSLRVVLIAKLRMLYWYCGTWSKVEKRLDVAKDSCRRWRLYDTTAGFPDANSLRKIEELYVIAHASYAKKVVRDRVAEERRKAGVSGMDIELPSEEQIEKALGKTVVDNKGASSVA